MSIDTRRRAAFLRHRRASTAAAIFLLGALAAPPRAQSGQQHPPDTGVPPATPAPDGGAVSIVYPSSLDLWSGSSVLRVRVDLPGPEVSIRASLRVRYTALPGLERDLQARDGTDLAGAGDETGARIVSCRVDLPADSPARRVEIAMLSGSGEVLARQSVTTFPFVPELLVESAAGPVIEARINAAPEALADLLQHPERLRGRVGSVPVEATRITRAAPPSRVGLFLLIDGSDSMMTNDANVRAAAAKALDALQEQSRGSIPVRCNVAFFDHEYHSQTRGATHVDHAVVAMTREIVAEMAGSSSAAPTRIAALVVSDFGQGDGFRGAPVLSALQTLARLGVRLHVVVAGALGRNTMVPGGAGMTGGKRLSFAELVREFPVLVEEDVFGVYAVELAPEQRDRAAWRRLWSAIDDGAWLSLEVRTATDLERAGGFDLAYSRYLASRDSASKGAEAALESEDASYDQKLRAAQFLWPYVTDAARIADGRSSALAVRLLESLRKSVESEIPRRLAQYRRRLDTGRRTLAGRILLLREMLSASEREPFDGFVRTALDLAGRASLGAMLSLRDGGDAPGARELLETLEKLGTAGMRPFWMIAERDLAAYFINAYAGARQAEEGCAGTRAMPAAARRCATVAEAVGLARRIVGDEAAAAFERRRGLAAPPARH
ncbi:MAG: hypothetical protein MUF27_13265 [Acidobacteria bacterium]|nr:hypothetical protein [Acidobacteriota bacterium]